MWRENFGSPRRFLNHLRAYKLIFWAKHSFLHSTGWLDSFVHKHPRTKHGNGLPWMNYGAIHLLKQHLTRDIQLFEYGSGYSTLFFSDRVNQVTSVEYDKKWFELLRKKIPNNVDLRFQEYIPNGDYCKLILSTQQKYDVVVIDGRDRVRCAKNATNCLSDKGVIIFDDSHRSKYAEAFEYLRKNGFKILNIVGVKPGEPWMCQTTIAYRNHNCLGF
ncbi:MAG: FkbM family methyltransferase [Cyanobacteria bacterium P01_F01_bin.153]